VLRIVDADADEIADRAAGVLFELGFGASALEEFEGYLTIWTSGEPDAMDLTSALTEEGLWVERVESVAPDPVDWNEQWKIHFQPFRVGPLWIGPTWHEPPGDAELVLRLDPSMAFGTGLHPSTRLCLEALADLGARPDLLDAGTGSGILALASLRLGTPAAVGTDVDPESLRVARENAEANDLSDRFDLTMASPDALRRVFSTVVANILAQPLIDLAPSLAAATAPGGRVLLAGILETQVPEVEAAFIAAGLRTRTVRTQGEWALLELDRP
jgi:ribosomal protein L11 methyltransferase